MAVRTPRFTCLVLAALAACNDSLGSGTPDDDPPYPIDVALGAPSATPQYGDPEAGLPYGDPCPPGQALRGFHGFLAAEGHHGRIQAICGGLVIGFTNRPVVGVIDGATLPLRGTTGVSEWTRVCPTPEVVVGFSGRSGTVFDRLVVRCARLEISLAGDTYVVGIGTATDLAGAGETGGAPFDQTDCGAGAVATRMATRANGAVYAFGLGCSAASLVFP